MPGEVAVAENTKKNTKTTKKLTTRTPFLPNPPGSGSEPRTPGKGGKKKSLFLHPPLPPPGWKEADLGARGFFRGFIAAASNPERFGEEKGKFGLPRCRFIPKGGRSRDLGSPNPKIPLLMAQPWGQGIPLPSGGCKFVNVLIKAR